MTWGLSVSGASKRNDFSYTHEDLDAVRDFAATVKVALRRLKVAAPMAAPTWAGITVPTTPGEESVHINLLE